MIEAHIADVLGGLPNRICDVVKPWSEKSPHQISLVEATGSWTYGQLNSVLEETRSRLLQVGVRPGDRVMIVSENSRAFIAVLLATVGIDAWPVLVNARLSARELDAIRDHCGARCVTYTTAVSVHAKAHAKRHEAVEEMWEAGPIGVSALNPRANPEPIDKNTPDSVAALIYTSGTTGQPKGVMLTHRNLLFMAAVSAKIRALTPSDRIFGILPMTHAVGLAVVLLGGLLSGATLYLAPRFDPMTARTTLERDALTVMLGVPSMFSLFVQYARLRGFGSLNLPALRIISSSGAPLDFAMKEEAESLFGLTLHNGYGVTECSPTIAQTRIESPRRDTSVGQVLPGVEVKLVDPHGEVVAPGEVGELCVRGPNVMKGYYRAPEETAAAIDSKGWFNTRDLARLEQKNLFVVGRAKDLVVRSGFNVYPMEVETVLNSHPEVFRSAVIGRPVKGDEELIAFVQLQPGSQLNAIELAEYTARQLAPYKRPSQILLIQEMPLTSTGKIVKGELISMIPSV